jgi:ribosomal protein S18 acetylase RimI-like enzyme
MTTVVAAIPRLQIRAYRGTEDLPGMREVYLAAHRADGLDDAPSMEQFDLNYSTLVNCEPTTDVLIAEVDGRQVAYGRVFWTDQVDGGRSYETFGFVHPDWRRRGIGTELLRRNEARLREIAAGHEGISPQWLSSEGADTDEGNRVLLTTAGYRPVRYFYDMVQPSLATVPSLGLPAGLEARPVSHDQFRQIWEALAEAFRDHWGEPEWTDADWRRFEANPDHADPSLWRIAWDRDEVAGGVVTTVPAEENAEHGRARVYVAMVAIRRPWRRRGLARALLAESMIAARDAGFTSASLGVDADSPTGALSLYESLGFVTDRTFTAYRKPL